MSASQMSRRVDKQSGAKTRLLVVALVFAASLWLSVTAESHAPSTSQPSSPTTTTANSQPHLEPNSSLAVPKSRPTKPNSSARPNECEYSKGAWQPCQADGYQKREFKLVASKRSQSEGLKCDRVKVVQRQCSSGCKYSRGQWSPVCVDGVRVRTDTLIWPRRRKKLRHNSPSSNSSELDWASKCQLERKVTRECRRSCHYIKSAWSECNAAGYKTRNLTLDDAKVANEVERQNWSKSVYVQTGVGCSRSKQITRLCRNSKSSLKTTTTTTSSSVLGSTWNSDLSSVQSNELNSSSDSNSTRRVKSKTKKRTKNRNRNRNRNSNKTNSSPTQVESNSIGLEQKVQLRSN